MKKHHGLLAILAIGMLALISILYKYSENKDTEKILHIYTWTGTFDPALIKEFEKETGIKVYMDYYDSDEALEAKLLTGNSGYDIVMPSAAPYFGRQVLLKDKAFMPLDKSKLSNWHNLDKNILSLLARLDKDNTYGVPFSCGTTGFAYDARKINKIFQAKKTPIGSLDFVFNLSNIKKLSACGVSLMDYPQDLIEAIIYYKKRVPDYKDFSQIELAQKTLEQIRPYVKNFTINTGRMMNDLINGEACVVHTWSGEALRAQLEAKASKKPVDILFFSPKEYQGAWCDLMVIPKSASHVENAHKFLNFMLRADIAARNTKALLIPLANAAAVNLLPPSLKENPLIYAKNAFKDMRLNEVLPLSFERELTRVWTKTKVRR